ncbi:MAG: molybdopterin molybdotransferase MoeA [Dehalococcoidia bacterium]
MISVEQALEKILNTVSVLEPETKPILDCLGQVLAEDVVSGVTIPPLDNSAMDGYAVRREDIQGASESRPRTLYVIGEVAAGSIFEGRVEPGTCVRIMTGAPVPDGADTVVQFEHTDEEDRKNMARCSADEIGILRETEKGKNIRPAGEDVRKGEVILEKGTVMRPQEAGVLASIGQAEVSVIRRPVVAVMATGDELIDVGEPLPPGKIYNSNAYSTAAQVLRYGGIPLMLGIGRDNREALSEKISSAIDADMLLTSGGVSVGDYDIVKDVLAEHGSIGFWTVYMKPGKPLAFGMLQFKEKKIPHLGFPGNPVSSMITFEQFARPAILKMMGRTNLSKPTVRAISESRFPNTDGRRVYARGKVEKKGERYYVRSTGLQGSGILTSMTKANGLVVVPEDTDGVWEGDEILVQMLDWQEEI